MMHYRGKVFRPPFEENSLLIEATVGCSRDKCAFCSLYHDTPFAPSPMEDIESNIRFIGRNRTLFKRVFLVGGDPFALPFNRLQRIGELVGDQLPRVESIGCYASVRNILAKTPEQLSELAKLGYSGLNIGLETGLDDVLEFMDKGNTVDEAREAGMKNMAFVTGRGKRALEDYFDISYELENEIKGTKKEYLLTEIRELMDACNFSFTRQSAMRGLGDAIYTGRNLVGDEAFGVILADDLCINEEGENVMSQMVKIYEKYRCSIVAVMEVNDESIKNYGVVAGKYVEDDLVMVSDMIEKPEPAEAPTNLAIIGRYVLTPDIFEIIKTTPAGKNGEVQITDALLRQAKNGMVLAYKFKGRRFDCGSIEGFVEATNFFYDHR